MPSTHPRCVRRLLHCPQYKENKTSPLQRSIATLPLFTCCTYSRSPQLWPTLPCNLLLNSPQWPPGYFRPTHLSPHPSHWLYSATKAKCHLFTTKQTAVHQAPKAKVPSRPLDHKVENRGTAKAHAFVVVPKPLHNPWCLPRLFNASALYPWRFCIPSSCSQCSPSVWNPSCHYSRSCRCPFSPQLHISSRPSFIFYSPTSPVPHPLCCTDTNAHRARPPATSVPAHLGNFR